MNGLYTLTNFKTAFVCLATVLVWSKCATSSSMCSSSSFHVNDGLKDRALESRTFLTVPIHDYHSECFSRCTKDCRCLSFNVCGKQCQLNADIKDMRHQNLKRKHGCSYYELRQIKKSSIPQCCLMSNPCQNGGICSPVALTTQPSIRRFSCLCRRGWYGSLCETKNPRSCADFMKRPIKPFSGEYKIFDDHGNPYAVFCDFDSEPGYAWTLVLSFTRDNALGVQSKGFLDDLPVNKDALNWENFRLSLSRMNSVRQRSSHWRATCGFDVNGVDYQEYIRVNLSNVDFSAYYFDPYNGPSGCQTIEYMNIWGTECHNCNFAFYTSSASIPSLYLEWSKTWSYCSFDLSSKQHKCGDVPATLFIVTECLDLRSKCQITSSSTTQNWFGESPTESN